MSYGASSPSVWLSTLPASLSKAKKSLTRRAKDFAAEHRLIEYDIRVPGRSPPTPALLTSLGLLLTTLRTCRFSVPSGTLGLSMMQFIVFLKPDGVSLSEVSLQPRHVIRKREYHRLITSAFTHSDLSHALFSVNALIEAGNVLENKMGVVPFIADVALVTLMSHGLYVFVAWMEYKTLDRSTQYYTNGIGFSFVAFALSTVTGMIHVGDPTVESSVPHLPVCYHVWAQLLIAHIWFPRANFFGNLIGVSAGLVRVFCPRPFLWIRKKVTHFIQFAAQQPLCNGMDDERSLVSSRKRVHLIRHLCLLGTAWTFYFFQTRPGKKRSI
eukprot:g8779.t1